MLGDRGKRRTRRVSSERTIHLELLLKGKRYLSAEPNLAQAQFNERLAAVNNLDNSICSTAARQQHATGKACEPRAK